MQGKAQVHYIPSTVYDYPDFFDADEEIELQKILTSEPVARFIEANNVQRGDIVVFHDTDAYRNDYRFIYDGEQICSLCWDGPGGYDYGIVPPEFLCVTEFPVDYWNDALHAWRLVWISWNNTMKDEILTNAKLVSDEDSTFLYKSHFFIEGVLTEIYVLFSHTNGDVNLSDILDKHIALHSTGDKITMNSICYEDEEVPCGPNIVHIVEI
jgi:hypothetical protein